jgi:hypothetical protein
MGFVNHRENVASRKVNAPEDFEWFSWECLDDGGVLMEGSTSSGLHESGPRKGRPKFDGPRKKTVVTEEEHTAERLRYEAETGNCFQCGGDGQMSWGWDNIKGSIWRPCDRCAATGKPPSRAEAHVGEASTDCIT